MKLLYLKKKMNSDCTAAGKGQSDDFEDSRCFFLSIFCFLLDIFRAKICQGLERAFPRPRDEAVVSGVIRYTCPFFVYAL
jgi:hypothetical protein